jgi:hypothetical protein
MGFVCNWMPIVEAARQNARQSLNGSANPYIRSLQAEQAAGMLSLMG